MVECIISKRENKSAPLLIFQLYQTSTANSTRIHLKDFGLITFPHYLLIHSLIPLNVLQIFKSPIELPLLQQFNMTAFEHSPSLVDLFRRKPGNMLALCMFDESEEHQGYLIPDQLWR